MSTPLRIRRQLAVIGMFVVSACDTGRGRADANRQRDGRFEVGVVGDMPYHAPGDADASDVMATYQAVLDTLSRENLRFVVHIGDITRTTCTDSVSTLRRREFDNMAHPLIYTFGDNEWVDCDPAQWSPTERLESLRRVFTRGDSSHGKRRLALVRQSASAEFRAFRENVRWQEGDFLFLTIHTTGSNNNRGRDTSVVPAEFAERNRANIQWLRDGFAFAQRSEMRGVAVFTQANPGLTAAGTRWTRRPVPDGFAELLDTFQQLATAFGKPVAFIHGDTHYFRVDQPFVDRSGNVITNIVRAETFGTPNLHALRVTVDPDDPNIFSFGPIHVRK